MGQQKNHASLSHIQPLIGFLFFFLSYLKFLCTDPVFLLQSVFWFISLSVAELIGWANRFSLMNSITLTCWTFIIGNEKVWIKLIVRTRPHQRMFCITMARSLLFIYSLSCISKRINVIVYFHRIDCDEIYIHTYVQITQILLAYFKFVK